MARKTKSSQNSRKSTNILTACAAAAAVMLAASVTVWAVRAYLSTQTDALENEFTPITYTNTSVQENYTPATFTTALPNISKEAWVENNEGGDIKPVFVRMAVTAAVTTPRG